MEKVIQARFSEGAWEPWATLEQTRGANRYHTAMADILPVLQQAEARRPSAPVSPLLGKELLHERKKYRWFEVFEIDSTLGLALSALCYPRR